jgi:type I restriction enzyme S subunit
VRFKGLFDRLDQRNTDLSYEMLSLRSTGEVVARTEMGGRQEPDETSLPKYLVAEVDDLVVNPMWLIGGGIGVSGRAGAVSPDYRVFRYRSSLLPRFIHYLLRSQPYLDQYLLYTRAQTTFDRRVQQPDLDNLPIPVPPLEEQRAIADYLDRETARVDTLIDEQQRLIEMLHERRKALIEKAVFAGLWNAETNNRPESWLPSTPVHWRVVQLGFVSDTLAGYAFPSYAFSADDAHARLLRGVNVKPGRIDWAETVYWDTEASAVPSEYELEAGDLVFGMDRPFVGSGVRVAAISSSDLPALLLQRVMRIRPTAEGDRGYVRYVMSTDAFFDYLEPLFTGVSVPHVSEWQVRKFKMPFPSLDEQRSIAAHLDDVTAKIDQLIAETERFVDLARERRAALITAAVTGQIDVREAA